jgi:hypothetical protein
MPVKSFSNMTQMRIAEREADENKARAPINKKNIKLVLHRVSKALEPMARSFLMSNYQASGLGKSNSTYRQTGLLAQAISISRLVIYLNKKDEIRVWVMAPAGIPNFENQKKAKPGGFYRAMAALNYGAVHGASMRVGDKQERIMGVKARKSLKLSLSGVERSNKGGGRTQALKQMERKLQAARELSGKEITVRKAYDFFRLSSGQTMQIRTHAVNLIRQEFRLRKVV